MSTNGTNRYLILDGHSSSYWEAFSFKSIRLVTKGMVVRAQPLHQTG